MDEVGIGSGVMDRLKQKGYPTKGYTGGRFTTHTERHRFFNLRAKSHWKLRELLEGGKIALPTDEQLFDELMSVNWTATSDDRVQIESKSALKRRLGRSPGQGRCSHHGVQRC